MELKTHIDSILLSVLYRPPNTSEKIFFKNYQRLLNKFNQEQLSRLVIGMDHNFDFLKHEKHRQTKEFIELNLDYQLLLTITKPTRITRSSSTLINNITVGKKYQGLFESHIGITDISDHLPLVLTLKEIHRYEKAPKEITTRKLDAQKIAAINSTMKKENCFELLKDTNADESFNIFNSKLEETIETIAPQVTLKISKKKIIKEKCVIPGLLMCLTEQRLLYRKTIKTDSTVQDHQKYKDYRNKLQCIMRKTKEDYYKKSA